VSASILHGGTATAAAAATTQPEQLDAIEAAFAGDITVRAMAGAVVAEVCTYGTWARDSLEPRGMTLGSLSACTVNVTDATITSFVFVEGGTPIFSIPAADASLDSPTTKTGRRTSLADAVLTKHRIIADATLPLGAAPTYLLTFALADTATVDLAIAGGITNTGTGACAWSITPPAHVTVTPSSGTLAAGGTQSLSVEADTAGTYSLTLVSVGATITNATQSIVASEPSSGALVLTGPSSGLESSLSSLFTVSHTGALSGTVVVTPSDGAGGQFWPLVYAAGGVITLGPSTPTALFYYAPSGSGAKSVTLTNDAGLTNPSAHAFTSAADSPGSATPFRLVRGGSTIGSYATLQECKDTGGWASGDTVKCTAGTYVVYSPTDPGCTLLVDTPGGVQTGVDVDTLTIEWETPGSPMVLDYSRYCQAQMWSGGQPQLLTMGIDCHDLTVRGLHFRGARTSIGASWLGAAIWTLTDYPATTGAAATLTIEYCKFWQHADGIKTRTHYNFSTYVRYCVFEDNSDAKGLDHDIYVGNNALLYVEGCTFRKTAGQGYPQEGMGHFIKSRTRATTIKGCLLHGYMSGALGGVAQLINTPNGGEVEITGNVLNHYGYLTEGGRGEPLRYGDDQHTATVDTNTDPALTTHTLLFAQNTVRQYAGHAVGTLTTARPVSLFPGGDSLTNLLDGAGSSVSATATIRNNILASDFTARLATFVGLYTSNSSVAVGVLGDEGAYSGATIAGSPAVNDADAEWAGDYTIPAARTDTNRGARIEPLPSWVPSTAWEWTDIPGTVWQDYMPSVEGSDPTALGGYAAQWAYSAPCYSAAHHELYMFGGGHAATSLNAASRYLLGQDSPTVEFFNARTPAATRTADIEDAGYLSATYHSDGKPYSPHSYRTALYSDYTDEMIVGLTGMGQGNPFSGAGWSSPAMAAITRAGTWRAAGYYPDNPVATAGAWSGPRCMSYDGQTYYWWKVNGTADNSTHLSKLDLTTKTHSEIGASVVTWYSRCAQSSDGTILTLGSENSGGAWLAKFTDPATGTTTSVTVSGDSIPSGKGIYGLAWCEDRGYWVSVWMSAANVYDWTSPSGALIVATITKTGSATATASIRTIATGDGVPAYHRAYHGVFYDPAYGCLIYAAHDAYVVKCIKLGA